MMNGLSIEDRRKYGAMLEHKTQEEVMAQISQFSEIDLRNSERTVPEKKQKLGFLVFNIQFGTHIREIGDFLENCPEIQPFDVILANELDDGCLRSGSADTTAVLAGRLGMDSAFGLEFIELADEKEPKGFTGNAIFSRYPVKKTRLVRFPEAYNWYFDSQKRIGGRLAVLAELDIAGDPVGVGTIHLENRTDGKGRERQLTSVLEAAETFFPENMPVVLGGDLNTNTYDGRDKQVVLQVAASEELRRRCLEEVPEWENCLRVAESFGYTLVPTTPTPTRRKTLPDGSWLPLRLDWFLLRGVSCEDCRVVSTRREDCAFAPAGSALEAFRGEELSDHNAVWAECRLIR